MKSKNKIIQKIQSPVVSLVGFSLAVIINLPHMVGVYNQLTGKDGWVLYVGFAVVELGILILSVNGKRNAAILFAWLVFLINGCYYWIQPEVNDLYIVAIFGTLLSSIPAYMLFFFSELFADYVERDAIREKYHELRNQVPSIKGQLTKITNERDNLRTELDKARTELDELRTSTGQEADRLRTETNDMRTGLDKSRTDLERLEQELDDYRTIAEYAALKPDALRKRLERTPNHNGHARTHRLLTKAQKLQRGK